MNFTIKKRLITEFAKRAYDSQVYSLDYLNVNIWIINSDMTVEFAGCYLENYMIYILMKQREF